MRPGDIPVEKPAPGVAVLRMPGALDAYTAPAVRELVAALILESRYHLIADLTDTTRIGIDGLSVLVGARNSALGHAGDVVLAALRAEPLAALRHTGLDRTFRIADTVADALGTDSRT